MTSSILDDIVGGKHDSKLPDIVSAVRDRQAVIAARSVRAMSPGDRVTLSDEVRPKYLAGASGTVVKTNRKTVVVKFGEDHGRFSNSEVRVPATLVHV